MRIVVDHVYPIFPRAQLIQWTVEDATTAERSGLLFDVQYSGSPDPHGEWTTAATGLDAPNYEITFSETLAGGVHQLSLDHEIWWRVTTRDPQGGLVASRPVDNEGSTFGTLLNDSQVGLRVESEERRPAPDGVFSERPVLEDRLHLVHRAVQRYAHVALERFTGVRVGVLKRRSFGAACTDCSQSVTRHVLIGHCPTCYGVGWEGGYFPATGTLMRITEGDQQVQLENTGDTKITRSRLELVDYPRLEVHDVVVELNSGRRWEVDGISDHKLRRRRVTQHVTATEIARSHFVYQFPIAQDLRSPLYE